jgi:hypothetical protein
MSYLKKRHSNSQNGGIENSENSNEEKIDFHQNIYSGEKLKLYPPTFVDISEIAESTRKHLHLASSISKKADAPKRALPNVRTGTTPQASSADFGPPEEYFSKEKSGKQMHAQQTDCAPCSQLDTIYNEKTNYGDNNAHTIYGDNNAHTIYGDNNAHTIYGDNNAHTIYGDNKFITIPAETDIAISDQNNNKQIFRFESNICEPDGISSQNCGFYIYGMMNIKKMDMIHTNFQEFILQVSHADFLCPLTVVDQNQKTNKSVPFLFSLDSLLYQIEKIKNAVLVCQFFIDDCCFHFTFRVVDMCNIKGYQSTFFVEPLCSDMEIQKIFRSNCSYQKIQAHSIVISYHINDGYIVYPKIQAEEKKKNKTYKIKFVKN